VSSDLAALVVIICRAGWHARLLTCEFAARPMECGVDECVQWQARVEGDGLTRTVCFLEAIGGLQTGPQKAGVFSGRVGGFSVTEMSRAFL